MNTPITLQPSDMRVLPSAPSPMKWMWVAIAALGVCVVALGTTLVVQNRPAQVPTATAASPVVVAESMQGNGAQPLGLVPQQPGNQPAQRSPVYAPGQGAAPAAQPQAAQLAGGTYPAVDRAPVCRNCGRVESVQAVQQAEPATGVGAVAGGVLGAVVGNQIGKGGGRTAATVLGAVGGGYVGHQVEQRSRTRTVYQVAIRMDDGSLRRFTRSQPPAVGTPITLEGKGYRIDQRAIQNGPQGGGGAYTQAPAGAVRVANGY